MKTRTKVILAGGAVLAALSGAAAAEPRINVDVNFGLPGFGYVAPPPVYYSPPVVYAPAPRFVRQHYYRDYRDWDRRHDHDRHDYRGRW